jgi:hypothetical protein
LFSEDGGVNSLPLCLESALAPDDLVLGALDHMRPDQHVQLDAVADVAQLRHRDVDDAGGSGGKLQDLQEVGAVGVRLDVTEPRDGQEDGLVVVAFRADRERHVVGLGADVLVVDREHHLAADGLVHLQLADGERHRKSGIALRRLGTGASREDRSREQPESQELPHCGPPRESSLAGVNF